MNDIRGIIAIVCLVMVLCSVSTVFILLFVFRIGTGLLSRVTGGNVAGAIAPLLGSSGAIDDFDDGLSRIPSRRDSLRAQSAPPPTVSFEEALMRQQQAKGTIPPTTQAPTFGAQSVSPQVGFTAQSANSPRPSLSKGVPYQPTYGQPQYPSAPQAPYGQPQYPSAPQAPYGQPQYPSAPQAPYGQPQYPSAPQAPYGQPQYPPAPQAPQTGIGQPPQFQRSIPRGNPSSTFDSRSSQLRNQANQRRRTDEAEDDMLMGFDSDLNPFG